MENFFLKDGQEDVLKNVLAGQRFDHTKTTTENDIWEFLDELAVGKKIRGFEVLPSKKAILTNGLLSSRRDTPFSTTYKGVNSLLIYMLLRDKQKYDTQYEKPNFKLEDINALLNDCIDTTAVSETNYGRFRRLVEKFSEDSNFGKCTLEPKKNGESIQATQVRNVELDNSNFFHQNVPTDSGYPKELMHLKKYEKGYQSWYEEFFFTIVKILPFWLKKFLYKERYERIIQVGNSELVRQKIEYYIPLEFEFKGTEYDNLSPQDIKLLQKETKQGLVDYLWKEAIKGGKRKYHFIFGGIGQGKTALLVKLYAQYHRFLFDFIDNRIVVYFNIDENLETKLDIFSKQVEYIEHKTGDQYETVVLLDALDEDYEANANLSKRLSDLKKILDKYNRVVITCRTQFFDSNDHIRREIEGIFKYENCRIAYIQKFKPQQINKYLKKRYKFGSKERKIANELITNYCDKRDFISQPLLLSFMDLLVDKKLDDRLDIQYKSQLYKYIIDRWQEKEASKKSTSPSHIEWYKNKVYDAAHQVAINIYKRDVIKVANFENKPHIVENVLSNEELTTLLEKIDKSILQIKKRSVFMRDSVGNWFFVHKSFLEFFTGHAAYQIPEFDTVFEYPKGFDPLNKKAQNSASFFYTELMLFKIRGLARQLNTFVINQENSRKRSKSFQHITQSDIVKANLLYTNDHKYEVFQRESISLISFIRCFKNLKRNVDLSLATYDGSLSILGNMRYLEVLILADSENPINFEEFSKFPLLERIEIRDSLISNISNLSNLPKLITFNVHGGEILDKTFSFQSNSIENLVLSTLVHSLKFLKYCPNIKNLSVTKYLGNDLSPISELSKLENVYLNSVTVDGIKILYQLCQKGNLQNISLEYDNITDEIFEAINLIKDKVVHLRFYGIRLDKKQVEAFYRDNLLYLNRQGIDNQNYSYKSIEKLRTISPNIIKNICVVFQGKYQYVSMDWREEWIIQFNNKKKDFRSVSISELSIYQFETIIMAWYRVADFQVYSNFKNLKQIYVSYVPEHKQLYPVFKNSKNRKSLFIAYTLDFDINLAPLQNLYFEGLEIREHQGKIFNLQTLQTCDIKRLTFGKINFIDLGHLIHLKKIEELHIHNIKNINNLLPLLMHMTIENPLVLEEGNDGNMVVQGIGDHIKGKGFCISGCGIQNEHLPMFSACGKTNTNNKEYEHPHSVNMLNLHNNYITDLTEFIEMRPIFGMSPQIKLDNNPINDLSPFDKYYLKTLSAAKCHIFQIPNFNDCRVFNLMLRGNPLVDISGLSSIKAIMYLDLRECPNIKSYECLKDLDVLADAHLTINKTHIPQLIDAFQKHESIKNITLQIIESDIDEYRIALSPIQHLIKGITVLSN